MRINHVYEDLVGKVHHALQQYSLKLLYSEAGPHVDGIVRKGRLYYQISFVSFSPQRTVCSDLDVYAGPEHERGSTERNNKILSRLEQKLAERESIRC